MRGTVLCDVTDSLAGRSAAEFAGALGARLGLRLVLVHVVTGVPRAALESVTGRQLRSGAERTVAAIAHELGHDAETRVAVGDHAEALARVAAEEGADLVVVGARQAGLGGRNLRWTLARELEAATPVPVLVAPPSTRKRSDRRLSASAR
ncbi:MAG TPA: universal stress protein [Gaiellaceae bacterium]|jgi:nucleotide-binding universal stress UspA family protein|nr:universal stress protein [Gaiellaceae bacterium]